MTSSPIVPAAAWAETVLVNPALASVVSGLSPYEIRSLIGSCCPIVNPVPPIRPVRVGGRLFVRLDDCLTMAVGIAAGRDSESGGPGRGPGGDRP